MTQPRPVCTLCPICTRLSRRVPGPSTVSPWLPRSTQEFAPISHEIAEQHAAELRHRLEPAIRRRGEAEAFLADPGAGMQHHAAAEDGMADAAIGACSRQPSPISTAGPDRHMRVQDAAGADPRPGADDDAGADLRPLAHHRIRRHHRAGMDAGDRLHRRVQQRRDPGEAEIGLRRDQRDGSPPAPAVGEGLQQHHRAGLGPCQQRRVAAVVEEADILRPRRLQRRDAGEAPLPVALEAGAGGGGDIRQPLRAVRWRRSADPPRRRPPLSAAAAAGPAGPVRRPAALRPGGAGRGGRLGASSPRAAC